MQKQLDTLTRLFKFFSFRSVYIDQLIERLLLRNEVFFPKPSQLNDPADCKPKIIKDISYPEFKAKFVEIIDRLLLDDVRVFREEERLSVKDYKSFVRVLRKRPEQYFRSLYDAGIERFIHEHLLEKVGILSLTSKNNDQLLWAHYGDSHQGFCVGFSGFSNSDPKKYPAKVEYTAERPKFGYKDFLATLLQSKAQAGTLRPESLPPSLRAYAIAINKIQDFYLKKSAPWQYEDEFRLTIFFGGGEYHSLSPIAVSDIYLGVNLLRGGWPKN